MKYCKCCGESKGVRKFGKDKHTSDGLSFYCKNCKTKITKEWVEKQKKQDLNKYRENKATIIRRFRRSARGKYWTLKYNSKKKGMLFSINIEDFVTWYESQTFQCFYCKLDFNSDNREHNNPRTPTIDRRNNDKEYTLDNIVLACRRCNTVKGNWFTDTEMTEIANKYLLDRPGGYAKWH